MFKRLIRYDLIWNVKLPAYYYAVALLSAVLYRLTESFSSPVGSFIHAFLFGLCISMTVSTVINALIRCWLRFVNTSYKDQSYLFHTLPVKRQTLFGAHFVSSVLVMALTALGAFLCVLILTVGTEAGEWLKTLLRENLAAFILGLICVFLEFNFLYICGAAGTILGYSSEGNRTLKSFLYSALLYLAASAALIGFLYLIGLADADLSAIFASGALPVGSLWKAFLAADLLYLLFSAVFILIGKNLYQKKINVE